MQLDGAFRVLFIPLLLVLDSSSQIVPPPTNLTLSCDNFNVTARWEYRHPNTGFRVQIDDDPRSYETTNHHFDLSPSIWKSQEHYLGVHYFSVTAILGENQSSPVLSGSLSYNKLRPSDIECELAFPPVDLQVADELGTVTFQNPLYFYKYLQQAAKLETTVFEFSIITEDGKDVKRGCKVEDCQQKISLPKNESQCVTLSGRLCDQPDFRCVVFNKTGPICPEESTVLLWILLGVLLFVIFIIVIVLTIWICRTKAWTLKWEKPSLPKTLVQPLTKHPKSYFTTDMAPENDYSAVTPMGKKPCKSPSFSSEEEDLLEIRDRGDSRDGYGAKDPNGCYRDGNILDCSNQEPKLRYSSSDDNSSNDSLKTESLVMDLEMDRGEEQNSEENVDREDNEMEDISPYDCPHSHVIPTDTIKVSHKV